MNQYRRASAPVLPIAPSPIAVTGHKRKAPVQLPRRETSPAQLAPLAEAPPSPIVGKPSDYWKSLLNEWKIPILDSIGIEQDDSDQNVVFLETTSERVEAYQSIELLTAVRRRDMATLKRIATDKRSRGETMNACNRFGESILHLACRKGSVDVVQFLVGSDCNCSLLLRDDYGRTVLHDACWTVNPPWELIKLILKKAPVLWRVSDIRGHLAMQYIPKSAWPQWSAFLSKNKQLLQRIMVHSYHQIDIMQQQPPQPQQETPNDGSTNDISGVPAQNLPQHQQATQQPIPQQPQQNIPMPLPTPASRPVSAHNSEEKLNTAVPVAQVPQQQTAAPSSAPVVTQAAAAKPTGTTPAISATTALQAQDVLARALAQANPTMVQAISQGQIQGAELKQGLTTYSPSTTTPATAKAENATPQHPAPAPGPATAALDEALRAQSENRAKARSNLLLTEQQTRKEPSKQEETLAPKSSTKDSSQAPLPYAPSISMIAERLKGYQKNYGEATVPREEAKPTATDVAAPNAQDQASENPLPAVPNPLLGMMSEGESSVAQAVQQQVQDVPSDGDSSNPVSSVTMSASPSVVEGNGSDTTMNNTTDTDSDRAVTSSSSNPVAPASQGTHEAEVPMDTSDDGVSPANADESSENSDKPSEPASEKIIVG